MRRTSKHHDVRFQLIDWGVHLLFGWATVVIAIGIVKGETSIERYFSLKESERILSSAVDAIDAENNRLSAEITKLKSSPEYARKTLRDKYHVTDEDEKIIYYAD